MWFIRDRGREVEGEGMWWNEIPGLCARSHSSENYIAKFIFGREFTVQQKPRTGY